MSKDQNPELTTPIPGPRSRALADRLAAAECRNTTCLEPVPIFWERAVGANVWDADGNRYVDLTAAFGVANVGHAHPQVVSALQAQSAELLHGMGDVYPPSVKVDLLEALVERFPGGGEARALLGSSGSDAVETALKTALLATGKPGVIAFEGAYHGLSIGNLDVTWRKDFKDPFAARIPRHARFAPYGDLDAVAKIGDESGEEIGAVLVEPIQGRGGERVPPADFLSGLAGLCGDRGWLLIADEIYTGFGRTGDWFACEHEGVQPDLLCVGKGLASGMPISACVGRRSVMDAWPTSRGEALHTQTFIGHPVACASALACIEVIEKEKLVARARDLGTRALHRLENDFGNRREVVEVRGRGMMLGIEFREPERVQQIVQRALEGGVITLPSGDAGEVLSLTPPLTIDEDVFFAALDLLAGS